MSNGINFDSFFTETITDNNGISVCDVNAGLNNLYKNFNEHFNSFELTQRYFVPEGEEGYPDLIAAKSAFGSQAYWWWVLLINRQDDGLEGIKKNWVYSIIDSVQVNTFNNISTSANEASNDKRIGTVVELN